jgi:hypothetical protein
MFGSQKEPWQDPDGLMKNAILTDDISRLSTMAATYALLRSNDYICDALDASIKLLASRIECSLKLPE